MAEGAGNQVGERLQLAAEVVMKEVGGDASQLALPGRVVGHREDELEVRVDLLEFEELVEEGGGLAVAVRVDEDRSHTTRR